jgi:transketolase
MEDRPGGAPRPGGTNGVVEAWRVIVQLQHEPAVLVLPRSAIPTLDRKRHASAAGLALGA